MALQHVVSVLQQFYAQNNMLVTSNILFLFLYPFQDIILPHFYGKLMDAVSSKRPLYVYLVCVVSLLVFSQIMFLIADYHNSKLTPKLEGFIRETIVNNLLDKYESQYADMEIGDIITKLIKIPYVTVMWFERIKSYILPYIIVYVFGCAYFLYADWQLGLGLIITISTFLAILLRSPERCAGISTQRDVSFNDINIQIDDILNNLFSIYGGGQKEYEIKRLKAYSSTYSSYYAKTMECALKKMVLVNPIIIAYIIFFIYRCNQLITSNKMHVSSFISIFIIFLYILDSILVMNDQMRDIVFEWGMIDSSADLLYPHTNKKQYSVNTPNVPPPSGIGLSNVTFIYPESNRIILRNFSLHVRQGEKVCLVGDIGSGKSTIIKLLLKYYIPDYGDVYWNGQSYSVLDLKYIRRHIGYVPQNPILFNRSIIENILYGNDTYTRHDVINFIAQYNLTDEFNNFENGLDTVIGKNGSKLSGGQRQLIWCMRVILYNPDVIILDEPTASIDEKTKHIIQNMLNVIMHNKTVIMVTHDAFLENIATRIVTLSQGTIVSDTTRRLPH